MQNEETTSATPVVPDSPVSGLDTPSTPAPTDPGVSAEEALPGAPAGEGDAATPPSEPAPPAPETPTRDPWAFRVDGHDVRPQGAYRENGEIRIPEEVWDREIRPNYLGHRHTFNQRVQHLEKQLNALQDPNRPEIIRANQAYERLLDILKEEDPTLRDEQLEALHREIPILEAQAEARAARQQAEALRAESEERHQEELTRAVVPILEESLGTYVSRALQHERLKDLGLDAKELEDALWEEYGVTGLFEDVEDPSEAHFDTPAGGVRFNMQRIDRFLLRQADLVRKQKEEADRRIAEAREEARRASEAAELAKRNALALSGTDPNPAPPVVTSGEVVSGADGAVKPWHDPNKTQEERRELYAAHMRSTYGVAV